jgi:hypothetical protein
MKTFQLSAFLFLVFTCAACAQRPEAIPVALKKGVQAPPKTVRSYQDVISQVPVELRSVNARTWTRLQREEANTALQSSLIDNGTPARLHLKMVNVADWGGWTFYASIPNQEGYYIRVFGKFTDAWTKKFMTLKKGDTVILDGTLRSVAYEQLWGKFTLSICLKDCTFVKILPADGPSVAL